jgi:myo-inositol-1(or 4)-monophosphatase
MIDADVLQGYLAAAREAARRGAAVLEDWRRRFVVKEKGRFDLVTEADVASEKAVREYLLSRFPDHRFLAEEDRSSQSRPGQDAPPTWIIDPLDGTTNYVHDCPLYCVSIGLQIQGELVAGVVYDPTRHELFWAGKGLGAWLGDLRLKVSSIATLDQALIATGFPADMRGQDRLLAWWRYFSLRVQAIRRTGSTAINLAYLAAGRFDGYWGFDNHVWDVAGGAVLIQEAGGKITNTDGSPYDPYAVDAVAGNALLQPILVRCLQENPESP